MSLFILTVGLFSFWAGGLWVKVWRDQRRDYAAAIERRLSSWPGKP